MELKKQTRTYVAVSNDTTDKKLGHYINSSADPQELANLFIRERRGVYRFGSKKVFVKVEGSKIFGILKLLIKFK